MPGGVGVAITTGVPELLPDACVATGMLVVVAVTIADPLELWDPRNPIFGRTTRTATAAMRMITMIPAASRIFFLFEGFFGGGGTAVGMEEGTSGVGCRSFGEKSFGINRFFPD
jgi:hypothetical protein